MLIPIKNVRIKNSNGPLVNKARSKHQNQGCIFEMSKLENLQFFILNQLSLKRKSIVQNKTNEREK